jgi:hypothetical protein
MKIASVPRTPWSRPWSRIGLIVLTGAAVSGLAGCRRRPPPVPERPAPVALAGRVVDAAGRAVPDADVLAFTAGGWSGPRRGTSDVDGRFVLSVPPGTYRLLVEATGFPLAARGPVQVPAGELTIPLAGEGRAIAGVVTRAGAPAGGATVRLAAEGGGPERRTRTGPDGRFAVTGLGDGAYALRAEQDGGVSLTERGVSAPSTQPLSLALGPAQAVRGRVTEDGARPATGVEVRAEDQALPPGEDPLPAVARTDGAGGFGLGPLPPGRYRVTATGEGFTLRRSVSVDLRQPGPGEAIALELLRGARLLGRVTTPAGAPIAGARVRCAGAEVDDLAVRAGVLPLAAEAAAMPPGAAPAVGDAQSTVTDSRGRFSLDGLVPGRYRIAVVHDGYQPLGTEAVVQAGEARDLGALALVQGFPVRGRVLDEAGAPLEGARVAVSAGAGGATGLPGAVTDGAGQFALALAPGRYRVTATAEGRGTATAETEAESGGAQPALELRLARADASLEGSVQDSVGRPLARARLVVRPAAGGSGAEPPLGSASADAGGHFRIRGLPSGELRVEVQHPDYPRIAAPATPGQFASIVVPMPGGVAGEVRARATGALALHARVDATGPDGATAAADTRGTGTFRLLKLAPGTWRIRVSAPRMRAAEQQIDVPPSPTIGEPSVRDLRIDLDPA